MSVSRVRCLLMRVLSVSCMLMRVLWVLRLLGPGAPLLPRMSAPLVCVCVCVCCVCVCVCVCVDALVSARNRERGREIA